MPLFHTQLSAEGLTPDGKVLQVPPALVLGNLGPRAQITVGVAKPIAEELVRKGLELPPPATGFALIDTGASMSCVDEEEAQKLGLPIVDVLNIASASHSSTPCNVYPIRFEIVGFGITWESVPAFGAQLKVQGLIALIGRDVLGSCTLHYNGPAGEFTLAI